ncbi:signal recognition particle receptor subunit alpha, partial [bacterium]|nr:signal recognition particle receptor subunit alpha [bacterium]
MFNIFNKLKATISKTTQSLVSNVVNTVSEEAEFSDIVLEDMEDTLISADIGVGYAAELTDKLRGQTKVKPSEVKEFLKNEFITQLNKTGSFELNYKEDALNIYFITGVN